MSTKPMPLKLYDTLTREKRAFVPLDPANVRIYVCGPTVYDFAHIGNARPVIVFDVLFRLLRHLYGPEHVTYVRNITDVDDKINARAAERGIDIRALTEETYANFKADAAALGCLPPTVEPRATEYVSNPGAPIDMIRMIEKLVANGNAYAAEGHVLFSVASMPEYGRLARRSLDEMVAGARVEVAPYKRDPMDFVLWKPSPPDLPGWDSPWGRGRPGWHIECSAMSAALLGESFDIHGGGIDLVFPHHENEIAQSRCAFHTPVMANYWMHNGFLQVEGEKMAKSAGNFVTIRELLQDWPGQVARLAMLQTHYRQPIDFAQSRLRSAANDLARISDLIGLRSGLSIRGQPLKVDWLDSLPSPSESVLRHLADDMNTPAAIADVLQRVSKRSHSFEEISEVAADSFFLELLRPEFPFLLSSPVLQTKDDSGNQVLSPSVLAKVDLNRLRALFASGDTAGLEAVRRALAADDAQFEFRFGSLGVFPVAGVARSAEIERVELLLTRRKEARKRKDFAESDRIRDELAAMGVVLKDSKDGTTWEIAR